jgi:hypothetical protein
MGKSIPTIFYCLAFMLSLFSCGTQERGNRLHVGDIVFDPKVDNPDFKVCHDRIYQYYNFEKGNFSLDKQIIRQHFAEKFKKVAGTSDQNGYITIRFVVNCEGETDRFRVYEIDSELATTQLNEELRNQLLLLTKELKGWKPGEFPEIRNRKGKYDFYQYLTFKIRSGELVDILP